MWQGGKPREMELAVWFQEKQDQARAETAGRKVEAGGERGPSCGALKVSGRQLGFLQSGMRSHWSLDSEGFLL